MYNGKMEIGRVVLAKAGRDKGKFFIVVGEIDQEYVWIANGKTRSIHRPKKKKVKHLEPKSHVIQDLRKKIISGKSVFDAEIRKKLGALGYEK
jgi:large subunit ribosomal protein L14e